MIELLVASPAFALCQSADGRSYLVEEAEPYRQFWLSDRERLLFALFGAEGGMAPGVAAEALDRLDGLTVDADANSDAGSDILAMREAGVLVVAGAELSRYGHDMARAYLDHRPFPHEIAARIAALGHLGHGRRVLDLAAGPGSLALELARTGADVTIMELSRGFVAAALDEAQARGVALTAIHESCNRLPQMDEAFDVITVSQALHWLDDVAVCRGVCRNLAQGGHFFVVHGMLTLPPAHPLAYVLGDDSVLGAKSPVPFAEDVRALYRRTGLLFEALSETEVARHDPADARRGRAPVVPCGVSLFRQHRPIGEGFARAFLSDAHIAALGQSSADFWADLAARCAGHSAEALSGTQDFAVLQFGRGAARLSPADWHPGDPEALSFQPPAATPHGCAITTSASVWSSVA